MQCAAISRDMQFLPAGNLIRPRLGGSSCDGGRSNNSSMTRRQVVGIGGGRIKFPGRSNSGWGACSLFVFLHRCTLPLVMCPGFWIVFGTFRIVPPQIVDFQHANPFPADFPRQKMCLAIPEKPGAGSSAIEREAAADFAALEIPGIVALYFL